MKHFKEQIQKLHKHLLEAMKFKVGDKVKVVGNLDDKDKIGIIESINEDYYLVNINGKKSYFNESDLVIYKRAEAQAQQFNKGAPIKTIEGLSGTITNVIKDNNHYLYWVNHQGPYKKSELITIKGR